jgi:hypothetical protein
MLKLDMVSTPVAPTRALDPGQFHRFDASSRGGDVSRS